MLLQFESSTAGYFFLRLPIRDNRSVLSRSKNCITLT